MFVVARHGCPGGERAGVSLRPLSHAPPTQCHSLGQGPGPLVVTFAQDTDRYGRRPLSAVVAALPTRRPLVHGACCELGMAKVSLKLNKIESSAFLVCWPDFRCSIATRGWWLSMGHWEVLRARLTQPLRWGSTR